MEISWLQLLLLCPLVFLAGFVDAVAGGGGLISLPAYLMAGLPPHFAVGSNKFSSAFGTALSVWQYRKNGKILWSVALPAALGALAGAFCGTRLNLRLSDTVLHWVILCVLPLVALFLTLRQDFGQDGRRKTLSRFREILGALTIGFFIGMYDGAVGPGTGTFLILAFSALLGLDLLTSSGCAKVPNLVSNLTSMVLFLIHGKVVFALAAPAACCGILGNFFGSRYAVKRGSKSVRVFIYIVLGLLFVKFFSNLC